MNNKKQDKKELIYLGVIFFICIFAITPFLIDWDKITLGLNSDMKEKLDSYEDELMKCTSELESMLIYEDDLTRIRYKLAECKEIVDNAQIQINSWSRDKKSDEIEVAKIDYDSTENFIESYYLLLDINEGNFHSTQDAIDKLENALELINSALGKISRIESDYSHTEYYERYYLSREDEIQESKKSVNELKYQIQEVLDYYRNS